MKNLLVFTIILLTTTTLSAQLDYQLSSFDMKISGTSTMHDWEADVTTVKGNADITFENYILKGIESLSAKMETNSIKSEKGSMMDKNIYKALKADKHEFISFKMTDVISISQSGSLTKLRVKGNLTIAGTTKDVVLDATATNRNGTITFEGNKTLKMTDYNVQPPEFMLGAMKTGDEVTIAYKVTFSNSGLTRK